jgi:hypothetical protein
MKNFHEASSPIWRECDFWGGWFTISALHWNFIDWEVDNRKNMVIHGAVGKKII